MPKVKNNTSTKVSINPSAMLRVKPLMGYVLVEPSDAETKTLSGIILPESVQEKPAQGTVVSCGDDWVTEGKVVKCPVKVGDKVVYKKWGGDEIKVSGVEYKLVKFDDLMAILEG